ncbi:OB-fold domain-containing protein [Microbacterium resistens]|uniref:OB-fold domain-containing protein n=1 Tax=Microbacterium resistens TaxID=156977 RepID=A0ABY3RR14_9MICO|nr:OB-fold domain-containing protein [Microbacterium resistens]UGS25403.1 OB-fold domain-containing protein [Microbacterium resistens]
MMGAIRRPRPVVNRDNAFHFDALRAGRLVVQQCDGCGELRHPPVPVCPQCHSLAWHGEQMSGRGCVFSYVVMHHPVVPPFEPGYVVALVELEEGPRIVMNLEGIGSDRVGIGLPVLVRPERVDDEQILPVARPRGKETS